MDALKIDTPRITDAMKNLAAFLAAADLTSDAPHEIAHLLAMAKIALRLINAHTPPPPDEWAASHPQGDDESGTDRIEAITRYRACHALHAHATGAGHKVTKLLGRAYLRGTDLWLSGRVGDAVAAEISANASLPAHTASAFVAAMTTAIAGGSSDDDRATELTELVWAQNFASALQARRLARQQEVEERKARMANNESEAGVLREALGGVRSAQEEEEGEEAGADEEGEEEEEDDDEGPRVIELEVSPEALAKAGVTGL